MYLSFCIYLKPESKALRKLNLDAPIRSELDSACTLAKPLVGPTWKASWTVLRLYCVDIAHRS